MLKKCFIYRIELRQYREGVGRADRVERLAREAALRLGVNDPDHGGTSPLDSAIVVHKHAKSWESRGQ